MKTVLLFFAMALSFTAKSQADNVVYIVHSSSDTVIIGDSAWIDISYAYDDHNDSIHFSVGSVPAIDLCSYQVWDVDSMPHFHDSIEGVDLTRIKFIIPAGVPYGDQLYMATWEAAPKHVYVKDTTTHVIDHTGITELSGNKKVKSIRYYNLIGQDIPNLNEYSGIYVCDMIFTDNTRKVIKKSIVR